ncbi:MAG: hypothetical protein ACRDYU_00100 [Actinomycetes bacterium]
MSSGAASLGPLRRRMAAEAAVRRTIADRRAECVLDTVTYGWWLPGTDLPLPPPPPSVIRQALRYVGADVPLPMLGELVESEWVALTLGAHPDAGAGQWFATLVRDRDHEWPAHEEVHAGDHNGEQGPSGAGVRWTSARRRGRSPDEQARGVLRATDVRVASGASLHWQREASQGAHAGTSPASPRDPESWSVLTALGLTSDRRPAVSAEVARWLEHERALRAAAGDGPAGCVIDTLVLGSWFPGYDSGPPPDPDVVLEALRTVGVATPPRSRVVALCDALAEVPASAPLPASHDVRDLVRGVQARERTWRPDLGVSGPAHDRLVGAYDMLLGTSTAPLQEVMPARALGNVRAYPQAVLTSHLAVSGWDLPAAYARVSAHDQPDGPAMDDLARIAVLLLHGHAPDGPSPGWLTAATTFRTSHGCVREWLVRRIEEELRQMAQSRGHWWRRPAAATDPRDQANALLDGLL